MTAPVMAVLAPDDFRAAFDADPWPGVEIVHRELPPPVRRSADVYRIEERLRDGELGDPDLVLVVTPRSRSPRSAAPPAVVGSTTVALVQANRPADLDGWFAARRALATAERTVAVCGMGKRLFMEVGDRWLRGLRCRGWPVDDWRARRISKAELCERLARGPGIVVYAGHGRARGWSGYQALRWPHIEAVPAGRPCGLVIALACDTLTRQRGVIAFGSRWVASGRGGAYVGWCGPLQIEPGLAIADRMCDVLASGAVATPSALLRLTAQATTSDAEARELRRLRLIGDPLTPLWTPTGPGGRLLHTGSRTFPD
jgi:hypothetical protein